MTMEELEPLSALLASQPEWHVWVFEYGISHHRMVLAFHDGSYPRHAKVELLGSVHLTGDLQGGPYQLSLRDLHHPKTTQYELSTPDRSFRVVFSSARVLHPVTG